MRILGMMSGTSLDGIDAAVLETDGVIVTDHGPAATFPYLPPEKAAIQTAIADALTVDVEGGFMRPISFEKAEKAITDAHIRVVGLMAEQHDMGPIELIGFHGQTVLHRPDQRLTIQLGEGARLARVCGIDVVGDFRSNDVALGGQGAPLLPIYHQALLKGHPHEGPVAVLNIGGVANLTYLDGSGNLIAFDTGPGNGLLDQWMSAHQLGDFDQGGALAATGRVDKNCLTQLMRQPYFTAPIPKSLDRYDFSLDAVAQLSEADGAATLTAFSAETVARAVDFLPARPSLWVVCGGGRKNHTLMAELTTRTGVKCINADDVAWRGDYVEAEGFAYFAARHIKKLPLTFPGTTGIDKPTTGGTVFLAQSEKD